MRLVLAALSRPLTVIVALLAIVGGFFMAVGRMRMDIFPQVGNPVIDGIRVAGMFPHALAHSRSQPEVAYRGLGGGQPPAVG